MSIKLVATWTDLSTKTQDVMLLKTSSITCQRTGSGDTESRAFSNCSSAVSRGTEIKPPYCHCIFIMYSYKWHTVSADGWLKWSILNGPRPNHLLCIAYHVLNESIDVASLGLARVTRSGRCQTICCRFCRPFSISVLCHCALTNMAMLSN